MRTMQVRDMGSDHTYASGVGDDASAFRSLDRLLRRAAPRAAEVAGRKGAVNHE